MEKKHIIFALKLFLAGLLLGILAGFLSVNPLGISQAQVIVALYLIFLGLGLITATLTFHFTRKAIRLIKTIKERKRMKEMSKTTLTCIAS